MPLNHDDVVAYLKQRQQQRTDALLAHAARHPNKEWNWLHGILCASHGITVDVDHPDYDACCEDRELVDALFDGDRIAVRLDDLNRQAVEDYNKSKKAA